MSNGTPFSLRALPIEAKALIAKALVGSSLEKLGKVRVFPKGIPYPDEWIISVYRHDGEQQAHHRRAGHQARPCSV